MTTISSRELIERMRTSLPLAIELPDPVTGEPFTFNRDNVLALLAIDVDNLVLESQTVALMYGEMARVHAAIKLAKSDADVAFRRWKAQRSAEARRVLDGGEYAASTKKKNEEGAKKKPPTDKQVEEFYRDHPDYEDEYRKPNRLAVLADLLGDLKEAFRMKQRALADLHGVTFGHDRVASADDRMREMEAQTEALALPLMEDAARELEDIRSGRVPSPHAEPKKSTKTARAPKGASK